jgi:hypothetical protein
MANRYDEERWQDQRDRSYEENERRPFAHEGSERRQWGQADYDQERERRSRRERFEDPEWGRGRGQEYDPSHGQQYGSQYGPGERVYGPRHQNEGAATYGERTVDRPYSGTSSNVRPGGYTSHIDPYREGENREFGVTGSGANWGAADTGRHRLGSLTESSAYSGGYGGYGRRWGGGYAGSEYTRYAGYSPQRASHAGRGPKGFRRSDERIKEEVCERLTRSDDVDATNIEVQVNDATVILTGTVDDRHSKRIAEDIATDVWGAKDVQNQLRVESGQSSWGAGSAHTGSSTGTFNTGTSSNQASKSGSSGTILGLDKESNKR